MALFGDSKKSKAKKDKGEKVLKARARRVPLKDGMEHEVIRAPWFSEKALLATEKGVYAFQIPANATKAQVAGAIEQIFKVQPRKVRIVRLPAKRKSMRARRGEGVRAARHKAYVYLAKGDTIQFA